MNNKLLLATCVILSYFTIWYLYPLNNYYQQIHFIEEWNANPQASYRIEYKRISINRHVFSSPLMASISIHNMSLVFKNGENSIQCEHDIELSCWCFNNKIKSSSSCYLETPQAETDSPSLHMTCL